MIKTWVVKLSPGKVLFFSLLSSIKGMNDSTTNMACKVDILQRDESIWGLGVEEQSLRLSLDSYVISQYEIPKLTAQRVCWNTRAGQIATSKSTRITK